MRSYPSAVQNDGWGWTIAHIAAVSRVYAVAHRYDVALCGPA